MIKRALLLTSGLTLFSLAANADELSELKAQLQAATKSIEALQKRVRVLEADQTKAPVVPVTKARSAAAVPPGVQPLLEAPPVVAPREQPATLVPNIGKARLEVSGQIQFDGIYDGKLMDPAWRSTLRPSKIPVNCPPVGTDPGCGKDGFTNFSIKQTGLNIKGFLPTDYGEVKTELQFDLFGTGPDEGKIAFHLQKAYGQWGQFLFGQTESLFMDIGVFPNVVDYWGPSGMMFLRDPQMRWTPYDNDGVKLAVALEVPGAAVDTGKLNDLIPELSTREKPKYPDITGQLRGGGDWGHVQLAGVVRWISYDSPLQIGGVPADTIFGWGVNLTGALKTFGKDQLLGQAAYGEGIAAYSNDCCFDLGPEFTVVTPTVLAVRAVALPLFNWLVYYDHWWSDQWSSSIGVSHNDQRNSNGQFPFEQHAGSYASVNLMYYPAQNVKLGVEGLWGERVNLDGGKANDERVQFTAQYKF
jgi:hypothetical protein